MGNCLLIINMAQYLPVSSIDLLVRVWFEGVCGLEPSLAIVSNFATLFAIPSLTLLFFANMLLSFKVVSKELEFSWLVDPLKEIGKSK